MENSQKFLLIKIGLTLLVIFLVVVGLNYWGIINFGKSDSLENTVPGDLGQEEKVQATIVALGENLIGINVKPFLIRITPQTIFIKSSGGSDQTSLKDLKKDDNVTVYYTTINYSAEGAVASKVEVIK